MNATKKTAKTGIFQHRILVLALCFLLTCYFVFQATHINFGTSFSKDIPLNHSYIQTSLNYEKQFGSTNIVAISVCDAEGDIFNPNFFSTLKGIHDQLFFIPGVDLAKIRSLYSQNIRFIDEVDGGFADGQIIPSDLQLNEQGINEIKANIAKANVMGHLVSDDYSCAMIKVPLTMKANNGDEEISSLILAKQLEREIHQSFEGMSANIHIVGFTSLTDEVAEHLNDALIFFFLSLLVIGVISFMFKQSFQISLLLILSPLLATVWQVGALSSLDVQIFTLSLPMFFIVIAIGVSHSFQTINAVVRQIRAGATNIEAASNTYAELLVPSMIALLAAISVFSTMLFIDIVWIQEAAIVALTGLSMFLIINSLLLPVLLSYSKFQEEPPQKKKVKQSEIVLLIAKIANPAPARVILLVIFGVLFHGAYQMMEMKIGSSGVDTALLSTQSNYNKDARLISEQYDAGIDYLSVVIESTPDACKSHDNLQTINEFHWRVNNIAGVKSVTSIASYLKRLNAGYHAGNAKWQVLPREQQMLNQSTARIPLSSGLLNRDCSVMLVNVFLRDYQVETINHVTAQITDIAKTLNNESLTFKLALGSLGTTAATNQVLENTWLPSLAHVCIALFVLCLIGYKSIRAAIAVSVPIIVALVLLQTLMSIFEIAITVYTLPIIAISVVVGIDYSVYLFSAMKNSIAQGNTVESAFITALDARGKTVFLVTITLIIATSTWLFSNFEYQKDMGLLFAVVFLLNLISVMVVLPILSALMWSSKVEEPK